MNVLDIAAMFERACDAAGVASFLGGSLAAQ